MKKIPTNQINYESQKLKLILLSISQSNIMHQLEDTLKEVKKKPTEQGHMHEERSQQGHDVITHMNPSHPQIAEVLQYNIRAMKDEIAEYSKASSRLQAPPPGPKTSTSD